MIVGHSNQFAERRYSVSESQLDGIISRAFAEGYMSRDEEERAERAERRAARKGWKLQDSHRGLGRNLMIGGLGSSIGSYVGKSDVDEDYREGYSDEDIIRRAGERGAKYGAIGGLGGGAMNYMIALNNPRFARMVESNPKAAAVGAGIGLATSAGLGAVGGHLGSKKNAESRLELARVERRSK